MADFLGILDRASCRVLQQQGVLETSNRSFFLGLLTELSVQINSFSRVQTRSELSTRSEFKTCSASSSKTRQSYQLAQSSKLTLRVLLKLVQSYQLVKSYFKTCHASSPQRQIVRRRHRSSESRRSDRQREANSTRAFEGGISSPP